MAPLPVILDCDPGQDDALAMALAMAAPEDIALLGVTTVAGNVPLPLTQRNARLIAELCGRGDVPIFAGAARPLVRDLVTAEHVHGKTGLDGIEIREPGHPLQSQNAVDFIVATLRAADDDSIILMPTGPLTNIALALIRAPEIAAKIRRIVLMGGAMREAGNVTPSAEFNIYVDPHAADVVLRCGRPIVVMSLDVTHQVLSTRARVERIAALGSPVAEAMASLIHFFERFDEDKYGSEGAPLHDPCTVAWLLRPELFRLKPVHVAVETQGRYTLGATVVDYWGVTGRPANVEWAHAVDAEGFFDLLTAHLARY